MRRLINRTQRSESILCLCDEALPGIHDEVDLMVTANPCTISYINPRVRCLLLVLLFLQFHKYAYYLNESFNYSSVASILEQYLQMMHLKYSEFYETSITAPLSFSLPLSGLLENLNNIQIRSDSEALSRDPSSASLLFHFRFFFCFQ